MSKHVVWRSQLRVVLGTVALVAVTLAVVLTLLTVTDDGTVATDAALPPVTTAPTQPAPPSESPSELPSEDAAAPTQEPREPRRRGKPGKPGKPGTSLADRAEMVVKEGGVLQPKPEEPVEPVIPDTAFRVASLNVLGSSHTVRSSRYASGVRRMGYSIRLLNNYDIDVAGLQELQGPQAGVLSRGAPGFASYGPQFGREVMANSIIWRTDTWELVDGRTIQIPYFGGNRRAMPYVLLRNLASQQVVWFANFHNPADAHGPAQRWRNAATRIQIGLANRLTADGTPLVFTGDFNDREQYFCPITGSTSLAAANGGSTSAPCRPPARMDVDWVFGSDPITFTSFTRVGDGLVRQATDHPMIVASALIPSPNS